MKRILYIVSIAATLLCVYTGCKKEESGMKDDGKIYPRIFNETSLFPGAAQILNIGQTINFTGLKFSPGAEARVSWKVNDKEVSTDTTFLFTATTGGDFRIRLEVTTQGTTVARYRDVFVIPDTYTPKPYSKVMLSYLSDAANIADINWDNTTHIAYKVASVTAAGAFDISKGETNRKAEELVGRAHVKGIPVILGVSGALSGDGWSVSSSNNFGAVITDDTKRAALVKSIKTYITAKKMDGVDIMMTDINTTSAIISANATATGTFLNDLRAALGANAIITVTVTSNVYYNRYSDLSAASWLNVHAFEDGLTVGPGKALGQSSGYNYFVTSAELWKARYPATKLVIGMPAFGLRYNTLDANGNNLSWTSYDYIPYRNILRLTPDASDKEYAAISKGVYFNGTVLMQQKSAYLKVNGYLGGYIWAGDQDSVGNKSLTAAAFNALK
jgi:hypothetical protein